jgi:hypothetical protein
MLDSTQLSQRFFWRGFRIGGMQALAHHPILTI